MVFCDDHFDRSVEKCLSCIKIEHAIEEDAVIDRNPYDETSDYRRTRWDNDDFYYMDDHSSHVRTTPSLDRVAPPSTEEKFTQEDYDAFEELQYFDRDAERAVAYDS
jgi:hypothetical protein